MEKALYHYEQELLGAMLTAPDKVIPLVIGNVRKDEFDPSNRHGLIYEGILQVHNEGKLVNSTTVNEHLTKEHGEESEFTPGYLADLVNSVSVIQDQVILHNARQLREAKIQRNLKRFWQSMGQDIKDSKPVFDIIKGMREQADILTSEIEFEEFRFDQDILTDITGELDKRIKRYEEGQKVTGLKTGFEHLDNLINGLQTGLYVLGSAPSQGKTTFSKQLADQVAINNKVPVIFVSYEQSKFELILKSLSRLAQIDSLHLQKGNVKDNEDKKDKTRLGEKKDEYYEKYARYLVTIEAELNTTLDKIGAYAMRAMRERDADKCLIIIDYLQVIPYARDFKDKRTKIDEILTELRRLARRLDCPIWLVSSFSRTAYKNGDKKLDITSFKESGNIEYTADVAILMETEGKEQDQKERRTVHFEIIKNRNGLRGKIAFDFSPAVSSFKELSKEELGKGLI
jgi:replicative DNA helicase